jgi:hypothetical protein
MDTPHKYDRATRWGKRIVFVLSLLWAGYYFYGSWLIARLFFPAESMTEFLLAHLVHVVTVGIGPLVMASILLVAKWPLKNTTSS